MHGASLSGTCQVRAGTASNAHCHTLFASARLRLHGYLQNQTFNVMNDGQLLGHTAKTKISHDASFLSIQMTAENVPWGCRGGGPSDFQ